MSAVSALHCVTQEQHEDVQEKLATNFALSVSGISFLMRYATEITDPQQRERVEQLKQRCTEIAQQRMPNSISSDPEHAIDDVVDGMQQLSIRPRLTLFSHIIKRSSNDEICFEMASRAVWPLDGIQELWRLANGENHPQCLNRAKEIKQRCLEIFQDCETFLDCLSRYRPMGKQHLANSVPADVWGIVAWYLPLTQAIQLRRVSRVFAKWAYASGVFGLQPNALVSPLLNNFYANKKVANRFLRFVRLAPQEPDFRDVCLLQSIHKNVTRLKLTAKDLTKEQFFKITRYFPLVEELHLEDARLIPHLKQFAKLKKLTLASLELQNRQLAHLPCELTDLSFQKVTFRGSLWDSLAKATSLTALQVIDCGGDVRHILPSLSAVLLSLKWQAKRDSSTSLQDLDFVHFSRLVALQSFEINGSDKVWGTHFHQLPTTLLHFSCSDTRTCDEHLQHLGHLNQLQKLTLCRLPNVTGELFNLLPHTIRELVCVQCDLREEAILRLEHLLFLETLDVSLNQRLSGAPFRQLSNALVSLICHGCSLRDDAIPALRRLIKLERLDISCDEITGGTFAMLPISLKELICFSKALKERGAQFSC